MVTKWHWLINSSLTRRSHFNSMNATKSAHMDSAPPRTTLLFVSHPYKNLWWGGLWLPRNDRQAIFVGNEPRCSPASRMRPLYTQYLQLFDNFDNGFRQPLRVGKGPIQAGDWLGNVTLFMARSDQPPVESALNSSWTSRPTGKHIGRRQTTLFHYWFGILASQCEFETAFRSSGNAAYNIWEGKTRLAWNQTDWRWNSLESYRCQSVQICQGNVQSIAAGISITFPV